MDAFVKAGGAIFEQSRVVDVADGEPCVVTLGGGEIHAKDVVVATHFPIANSGLLFAKMAPLEEYAIAGPIDPSRSPADMYISAGSGGWSLRTADVDGERLLIVVGYKDKVGEGGDTAEQRGELRGEYPWTLLAVVFADEHSRRDFSIMTQSWEEPCKSG